MNMKVFVGFFGFLMFVLIGLILLLNRGPSSNSTTSAPTQVKLVSFANQSSIVSHTTHGRLVGDTERRSVRVSVTPTERRIEILSGYDQNVIKSQSYPNTVKGYETFLSALDLAGFAKTKKTSLVDEKGVCPAGNQYLYTVEAAGATPVRTWSTSCSSSEGNFAGNAATIRQLFRDQIPDYSKQLDDVRL